MRFPQTLQPTRSWQQQQQQHLHGGDVLEKVLDAPRAVPDAPGSLEGQQREEFAVVRLIAVDLCGRAGAGGRTVQEGTQVAVKEDAEQKENLPAAQYPGRAAGAECAKRRATSIHAVTIRVPESLSATLQHGGDAGRGCANAQPAWSARFCR